MATTADDNGGDNGGDDGGDDGGNNPLPPVTVPPLPSTEVEPLDEVLTLAQAIVQCTLDGVSQLDLKDWNKCIKEYTDLIQLPLIADPSLTL